MAFKDKYWKTGVEDFLAYKGKKYNGEYPTFREVIEITEERYPDNEAFKAIVPEKLTFTYREALKKIKEIAYYLMASGAKKGDKIAVTGKNSPEWALAYFAISFAGCTIVPLDYSLHIEDMEKILTFGDVDRVFIDGEKINELDKDGKLFKEKISLEKASKWFVGSSSKRKLYFPSINFKSAILARSPPEQFLSNLNTSSPVNKNDAKALRTAVSVKAGKALQTSSIAVLFKSSFACTWSK